MNDASRELGAALGVAIMGSLAASQYGGAVDALTSGLPPQLRETAHASIAGALRVADSLPAGLGRLLRAGADAAFIDGIHLAVTVGALFAITAAVLVARFLPHTLAHEGAMHGALEAMEDAAELGLGGVPPIFADSRFTSIE
jgi:DHA2 family multidrug resistance protein-like MFS transporter